MLMSDPRPAAKRRRSSEEPESDDSSDVLLPIKYVRISSDSGGCSSQSGALVNRFPRVSPDGEPELGMDYAQANAVLRELAMQRELRNKYNARREGVPTAHHSANNTDEASTMGDGMDCSGN